MLPELHWTPEGYLDARVHEILTAGESVVDAVVGEVALLLVAVGAGTEADRLCARWASATERPAGGLMPDAVSVRAFRAVLASSARRPDWARDLPGAGLEGAPGRTADDQAQRRHLDSAVPLVPDEAAGAAGPVLGALAGHLDPLRPDARRVLVARAAEAMAAGDREGAVAALRAWAARSGPRPKAATVVATRPMLALLGEGVLADALGIERDWPARCVGDLVAALHTRTAARASGRDALPWPELIDRIMAARAGDGTLPTEPAPGPADPAAVHAAEVRVGFALPADYRRFLLTCDGLPADVVFPRLLGAAELRSAEPGSTRISAASPHGVFALLASGEVVEHDPLYGRSTWPGVRALLEHHLRLVEQIAD